MKEFPIVTMQVRKDLRGLLHRNRPATMAMLEEWFDCNFSVGGTTIEEEDEHLCNFICCLEFFGEGNVLHFLMEARANLEV